jgi:histidinol-phosphate aminotransferase
VVEALKPGKSTVAVEYGRIRSAIAGRLGLAPGAVLPGTGSMELIYMASRAFLGPGKRADILVPTFEEYGKAVAAIGAETGQFVAKEADDFMWDTGSILESISKRRPDILVMCNPNNPTGVYLERGEVHRLARAVAPGLFLVDEACLDFAEDPWDTLPMLEFGNVILLRSFTKTFALWPVRVGYALGSPALMEAMGKCRKPEAMSAHVEAVGMAALAELEHPRLVREAVIRSKNELSRQLSGLGLKAFPTQTSFVLVKVPDSGRMWRELRMRGIMVRDCLSFGLPGFIRIAAPPEAEIGRVARAFREALA